MQKFIRYILKKTIIMFNERNKHLYFFGILKKFQGLGIILKADEPLFLNNKEYFIIEIRFIFLRFWYTYTWTTKK